jgi:hypothetical protein
VGDCRGNPPLGRHIREAIRALQTTRLAFRLINSTGFALRLGYSTFIWN